MKLKSDSELNIIRTKIRVGNATKTDREDFLYYVSLMEMTLKHLTDEEIFHGQHWKDYMKENLLCPETNGSKTKD